MTLKPCPHCGGNHVELFWDLQKCSYVLCHACLMQGPGIFGDENAAKAWNALPRKVDALPDARLDELEELAGKATPGGWCYEEACGGFANRWAFIVRRDIHEPGFYSAIAEMVGEERTEDDAAFIAAANPAVVLSLIQELRCYRSREAEQQEPKGQVNHDRHRTDQGNHKVASRT